MAGLEKTAVQDEKIGHSIEEARSFSVPAAGATTIAAIKRGGRGIGFTRVTGHTVHPAQLAFPTPGIAAGWQNDENKHCYRKRNNQEDKNIGVFHCVSQ
ncbi:MAG: hypothetical protein K0U74_14175 [Alphaproteobacteria bacterium]|nr:hypothetical protein [Alphaproteobacteria bacterium]